ncbi:hypothetical protein RRF57_007599 [Xylaria bambusicola]|uniref:Uncharacterized protein n=1 Tax=Xylaria bambusicola TaxID=326684 RepID=A0AAN7UGG8_9PEZI
MDGQTHQKRGCGAGADWWRWFGWHACSVPGSKPNFGVSVALALLLAQVAIYEIRYGGHREDQPEFPG